MKTVYVICGVSGSGKSWILDNVRFTGLKLKSDDFNGRIPELLNAISNSKSQTVLVEKTTLISTFIEGLYKVGHIVKPIMVDGSFLQVKQQLIDRGGRITKGLYKRWKRMERIKQKYDFTFSGSSEEVCSFLESNIKNNIVYMVESPSNKRYIGQTSQTLEKRRKDHEYSSLQSSKDFKYNIAFHNAITKYGNAMKWTVLKSNLSIKEADHFERFYIKKYNTIADGYNKTTGGKQHYAHSEKTKQLIATKISKRANVDWTDKRKQKASAASKNSWKNPEIAQKRSAGIKKVRSSYEQRSLSSKDNIKRYSNVDKRNEMAIACGSKEFAVYKDSRHIGTWINAAQCAKELGFPTKTHISNCLHGRRKTYRGYVFRYVSEN